MPFLRPRGHPSNPPRPCGEPRRILIAATLWLALGVAAAAGDVAAAAKASAFAGAGRSTVTTIVAGIVGYTRWPRETRPIRLCTMGQGRGVDELLGVPDLGSAATTVPVRATAALAEASNDCDVIYVGTLAATALRDLLQSTVGRPVLMIGEGRDFCSDGGMFCLQPGTVAVNFSVNLDAIARSGLRVNPQVLRIARQTPGSGP
jgi:hypothetical protein